MGRWLKLGLKTLGGITLVAVGLYLVLCLFDKALYNDRDAMLRLKVASVTMRVDPNPADNRARILTWVRNVMRDHPDTELILFGEAALGFYGASLRDTAEGIDGETVCLMSQTAREYGIFLCFGMPEKAAGDAVFISQVLIGPEGSVRAVHRKFFNEKSKTFQLGTVPATFIDIKGIKTALIICSDIQHPVVRRTLAEGRPEVILAGLASPKDPGFFISGMIIKLLDSWTIVANRYGDEGKNVFDGQMVIGDPLGKLRASGKDREQCLTFDVGIDRRQSSILRMLRIYHNRASMFVHVIANIKNLSAM